MRILNKIVIDIFAVKHSDVKNALEHWTNIVEEADWGSHNDIKLDFPSADYIGNQRYVFNIKGNRYIVVAFIILKSGSFNIRFIGKHSEYDKIDCSNI